MEDESNYQPGSREHAASQAARHNHLSTNHPELTDQAEKRKKIRESAYSALVNKLTHNRKVKRAAIEASRKTAKPKRNANK